MAPPVELSTSASVTFWLISASTTLGTAGSCWQGYKIEEKLDICSVKAFLWHTTVEDGDDNLLCCPGDHLSSTKKFLRSFLERRKYPRCLAEFNGGGKYPAAGKIHLWKLSAGFKENYRACQLVGWREGDPSSRRLPRGWIPRGRRFSGNSCTGSFLFHKEAGDSGVLELAPEKKVMIVEIYFSSTENCCIEPVFKRIWLISCCAVKVPCIWHDDEQLICNGVWWDLILFYGFYDVTPYKRGMISWTPLGKDICPYGGRDDELVTTEHPRDTEGSEDIMYAGNTSRALCGCNCTCGTQSTLGCKWGRQRSTLRFYPRHGWKLKQEPPGLILVKSIFSI